MTSTPPQRLYLSRGGGGEARSTGSPVPVRTPPFQSFCQGESEASSHTLRECWGERVPPSLPDSSEVAGKTGDTRRISGLEKLGETTNENYKEKRKTNIQNEISQVYKKSKLPFSIKEQERRRISDKASARAIFTLSEAVSLLAGY